MSLAKFYNLYSSHTRPLCRRSMGMQKLKNGHCSLEALMEQIEYIQQALTMESGVSKLVSTLQGGRRNNQSPIHELNLIVAYGKHLWSGRVKCCWK